MTDPARAQPVAHFRPKQDLAALIRSIREIEQSSELSAGSLRRSHAPCAAAAAHDGMLPGTHGLLRPRTVHDVYLQASADLPDGQPSTQGCLANLAPLLFCAHLAACAHAEHQTRMIVWIGTRIWPSASALLHPPWRHAPAGPASLLAASMFVDARDVSARLWAADLALRSAACCLVIVDGAGFDLTATRRLQLAARTGDAERGAASMGVLVRASGDRAELSAASCRWTIAPVVPIVPTISVVSQGDARAAAPMACASLLPLRWGPQFRLTLEHRKAAGFSDTFSNSTLAGEAESHDAYPGSSWVLEHSRGPLCLCVSTQLAHHRAAAQGLAKPDFARPAGSSTIRRRA